MKETKQCTSCKEHRDVSEFYAHPKTSDGLQSRCKACQIVAQMTRKNTYRRMLDAIKVVTGCERCGYDENPVALHFHHRNPVEKDFTISESNRSVKSILEEVIKCDILCANCHAVVHQEIANATNNPD